MPMKISSPFTFVFLLSICSSFFSLADDAIDVIEPPKNKNLFTLKAEKDFVGAQVEIYNSKGEMITSQSLQKRKMVIDFDDAHLGTYTIKIVKGETEREYQYTKK